MTPNPSSTDLSRRPWHREAVALCALLAFGCTVVRAPASAIAPRIPVREGVAEPQLELWLESGDAVGPDEAAAAATEARSVLEQALAPRRLEEGDQLLVVRAQGVSRTASRRSNQHAAIAGMVVGVVVVAVVALAASKGSGGRSGGAPAVARAAPRSGVPRASPAAPRPPRIGPRAVPIPGPGHGPRRYGPDVGVDVAIGVVVPIVPPPPPPPQATTTIWHGTPPPGELPGSSPAAPAEEPPAAAEAAALAELTLPPLQPLDLESRGFFTGDQVRVELVLVDRRSGAPLWVKTVEEGTDPRDAEAMKALLDRALDEPGGWSMAGQ